MALLQWLRGDQPKNVEVIEVTADEYEAAKQRVLDQLGLTYEQLEEQAQRREFDSIRARKLWLLIGNAS